MGWNGGGTENKSSKNILDEILTFGGQFITAGGELVRKLHYKEEHTNKVSLCPPKLMNFRRNSERSKFFRLEMILPHNSP